MDKKTYEQNQQVVYQYCLRMLGDPQLSEDITHDTFLAYCNRAITPKEPTYWLLRVASNKCLAEIRKRIRRAEVLTDSLDHVPQNDSEIEGELVEHVEQTVNPEEFNVLISLSDRSTIKTMSLERGISYEQCRGLINRARRNAMLSLATVGFIGGLMILVRFELGKAMGATQEYAAQINEPNFLKEFRRVDSGPQYCSEFRLINIDTVSRSRDEAGWHILNGPEGRAVAFTAIDLRPKSQAIIGKMSTNSIGNWKVLAVRDRYLDNSDAIKMEISKLGIASIKKPLPDVFPIHFLPLDRKEGSEILPVSNELNSIGRFQLSSITIYKDDPGAKVSVQITQGGKSVAQSDTPSETRKEGEEVYALDGILERGAYTICVKSIDGKEGVKVATCMEGGHLSINCVLMGQVAP